MKFLHAIVFIFLIPHNLEKKERKMGKANILIILPMQRTGLQDTKEVTEFGIESNLILSSLQADMGLN